MLILSTGALCQEICDNGIDDDGDGLIDIFDTQDCPCGVFVLDEVVADFEEFSCCPLGPTLAPGSGIFCLDDGWGPANVSTADYFNTCGFVGSSGLTGFPAVPMPIPSGEGAVGMWSVGNIIENIGSCLDGAMQPGATYDLSMYIGFNENDSYGSPLDVAVTIFGSPSCSDFPAVGAVGCLQGTQGWEELHTFSVSGAADETWEYVETTFVSSMGAEAIAFSIACDGNPELTYHFMDDIHLSGYFLEENDTDPITESGDCLTGVTLEIPSQTGASYQWYYEQEPIVGANSNTYEIPSVDFQGAYHVEIEFAGGCGLSEEYIVFIDPDVLSIEGIETNILCFGDQNGEIDIDIQSDNEPFDISWNSGQTTDDIFDLYAGQYSVEVIDNYGCVGSANFFVNQPDLLVDIVDVTQPFGINLGSATVNTLGGVEPYYYEWSTGLAGEYEDTDEDLAPGLYFVTITDDNGCQDIVEFEIVGIYSVEDSVSISCFGVCTGTATLTIDGPDNDYFIDWADDNLNGFDITNICPGSYAYTVTDGDGAPFIGEISIKESDSIGITVLHADSLCSSLDNDIIFSEVLGGVAPYTYLWSDGSTADTMLNATIGSHTLTVTDSISCTELVEFNIYQYQQSTIAYEVTPAGCQGETIGAIDLTVSDGAGPFQFVWDNGAMTEDLEELGLNDYTVTVTDGNLCTYVEVITVGEQAGFEIENVIVNTSCTGINDGSILLTTIGGEMPFTFDWSNGEETNFIDNLAVGNYTVVVMDDVGCTWNDTFEIAQNSNVEITPHVINNDCYNTNLGAIELTINSNAPYDLLWDDGSSSESIVDLSVGDYSLILVDTFGCNYEYDYSISEGVEITYESSIEAINCYQGSDGSISISILTATDSVTYNWSNGPTDALNNNLSSGDYYLTIIDGLGCEVYDTFELFDVEELIATAIVIDNPCDGYEEGNISLNITGGSAPYTVNWNNGESGNIISGLPSGDYEVTVTDANGCEFFDTYSVVALSFLESDPSENIGPCNNSAHTLAVSPTGGIEPYTYLWESGEQTAEITITNDGAYSVTVTDDNGCTSIETYSIILPTDVDLTSIQVIEPTPANDDGYIEIAVTGGVEPYDIVWNTGDIGVLSLSSLSIGEYVVVVTDAAECSATLTFTFTPTPLNIMHMVAYNPCFGSCVGSIETIATEGVEPYDYLWSTGDTESTISNLCSGEYQVTITDGIGQVVVSNFIEINSPPIINLEGSIYDISCIQSEDGAITIDASGGTEPFAYDWNINEFTDSIANLASGTYIVTVADDEGCEESEEYTLEDIPLIDLSTILQPIECDEETGSITIEGNNEYGYGIFLNQSEVTGELSTTIDNLPAGNYSLSYVVNPNCIITVEEVEIIPLPDYNLILSLEQINILEKDSALIELTVDSNDFDAYSIVWNANSNFDCASLDQNGECLSIILVADESEIIEVVFIDSYGCETILRIDVNVIPLPPEVYIPNVFSPNGDGSNDFFTIISNKENVIIENLYIYDRWGNLLYLVEDQLLADIDPWNGTYQGRFLNPGVYVYMINALVEGREMSFSGDVTITK